MADKSEKPKRDTRKEMAEVGRKELWEARQNQVAQSAPPENSTGYKSPPPQTEGFASETAAATGKSKQDINRSVKRAHDVCQEARDMIRNTYPATPSRPLLRRLGFLRNPWIGKLTILVKTASIPI